MNYEDYITAIQNGIDDANDCIRRLEEAQERLARNPNDVDLQNSVTSLQEELRMIYENTQSIRRRATREFHTDSLGNVADRENSQNINDEFKPRLRKIWDEMKNLGVDTSVKSSSDVKHNDIKKENNINDKTVVTSGDDLIPGTNFKKPRARGINESDEDYIEFLNNYYTGLFQKINQNDNVKSFQPTAMVPVNEKDNVGKFQPTSMVPVDEKDIMDKYHKSRGKKEKNIPQIEGDTKVDTLSSPNDKDSDKKTSKTKDNNINVRGYLSVIRDLTDGLGISKKSGRYFASEIQVSKSFKNELKTGNWLYNVVGFLPKVTVKAAGAFVQKMWGKLTLNAKQKKDMKELVSRINEMPDTDVEILINEYTNNRMLQERFPSALNQALIPRIKKYNNSRVEKINEQITKNYKDLFSTYQEVNALNDLINNPNTSNEDRQSYINQKNVLLKNTIDEIKDVRSSQEKADKILSDGTHGFEEGSKASKTKMSIVGMRFAKDYDLNNELLNEQANLQEGERLACMNNNPEEALKNFIGMEELYSKNTKIENSIFGKRSSGEKYYSPLAGELNYSNDPFVKDLFSSIAIAGTILSTVNAINTHINEANQVLHNQQAEANRINASNEATMNQVHQTGQDIADKRDTFTRGFEAQAKQDVNNYGMTGERSALDISHNFDGWDITSAAYNEADFLQHAATHGLSDTITSTVQNIKNLSSSGAIKSSQAMEQMNNVVSYSQHALHDLASNYMSTLTQYAQNNPYDLAGVQDALQHIVDNPTSIINMNQAAIDVTNLGESLTGLSFEQVQALQSLPSDMLTTLIGDIGAITYIADVENTMKSQCKTGKYGNEVTNLVNNFVNNNNNEDSKSMGM